MHGFQIEEFRRSMLEATWLLVIMLTTACSMLIVGMHHVSEPSSTVLIVASGVVTVTAMFAMRAAANDAWRTYCWDNYDSALVSLYAVLAEDDGSQTYFVAQERHSVKSIMHAYSPEDITKGVRWALAQRNLTHGSTLVRYCTDDEVAFLENDR
jgi:hypothetical protein